MEYYARSSEGQPPPEWQPLLTHLQAVSKLAAQFSAAFDSADWGRVAGLWHDLGKYRAEFQRRLAGEPERVDHAIVGALLAHAKDHQAGLPLTFVIAGHHAGLANFRSSDVTPPAPLVERLQAEPNLLQSLTSIIPETVEALPLPSLPARFTAHKVLSGRERDEQFRSLEFWIRFLLSSLVDADRLDAEAVDHPNLRATVTSGFSSVAALRERVDHHIDEMTQHAEPTAVNRMRADVLEDCRRAAELAPGVFSLTVPTGGGKTLSAMSFALRHAERHGLRRVIAVIPYTSIIEQNAAVYRKALGAVDVIEHHSNLDPEKETERNRMASENWDAPIIVTTGVQFFESLFSNRPTACRKLHNIAQSVILLDEAQTLPSRFLNPILEGLQELVANYGCTVVLSTATQPALKRRDSLPEGLPNVREIVHDPAALGRSLRRVEISWPALDEPPVAWPKLAAELAEHTQVLAVVHRREDARELAGLLASLLPQDDLFHLSALMCPMHRSAVLAKVKLALEDHRTCRLVSTQLVEAGVDIDFPVVYRALGGLDSIAQAAGRCNREGKLDKGHVIVFRAPTNPPRGTATKGLQSAESMLRQQGGTLNLDHPSVFEEYFRILYFSQYRDAAGIQVERGKLEFANVEHKFKLIEDGFSHPIVVPYEGSDARVAAVYRDGPSRENLRALQPFLINVYDADLERLFKAGAVDSVADVVNLLSPRFKKRLYSTQFGLVIQDPILPDAEADIFSGDAT
jgi:CRISPR-associated endonuclease/helicase Cas3